VSTFWEDRPEDRCGDGVQAGREWTLAATYHRPDWRPPYVRTTTHQARSRRVSDQSLRVSIQDDRIGRHDVGTAIPQRVRTSPQVGTREKSLLSGNCYGLDSEDVLAHTKQVAGEPRLIVSVCRPRTRLRPASDTSPPSRHVPRATSLPFR